MSADTLHEIKSPAQARTKCGMLVAQVESDFINQTVASMHALKEIGRRSLPSATAHGAQAALDVFYRAIDGKISSLHQAMRTADNAWSDLSDLRREAAQAPSAEFSTEDAGFLGITRSRARLNALAERHAATSDLLRRMNEVAGLYMNATLQMTQARAEIASLMNGASMFLTEQVAIAAAMPKTDIEAAPTTERERLSVVPPVAMGAFQYQPPVMSKEAVG